MASWAPLGSSTTGKNAKKPSGFMKNAVKYKHNFVQFFAMAGIFLLSSRSLVQKYRIHDLQEDNAALKQEQESLTDRMKNINVGSSTRPLSSPPVASPPASASSSATIIRLY